MKTPDRTEPSAGRRINVDVVDEASVPGERPDPTLIEAWVQAALVRASLPASQLDVAVLLVDEDAMRRLNRDYRGKDKPTNVLSFPGGEMAGLPDDEPTLLGDIVLCPAVVEGEAAAQGKPQGFHWAHLCVHGALHLAGYDHVEEEQARAMEDLEVEILGELGIPDPYEA